MILISRFYFIVFVFLLLEVVNGQAQTQSQRLVTRYQKLDISQLSGKTLQLINSKLIKNAGNDYLQLVKSKQKEFYDRYNFSELSAQRTYTKIYSDALTKTRESVSALKKDIVWRIDPIYYTNYGSDALSRYRGPINTSDAIKNFITPALQAGFEEYADSTVRKVTAQVLADEQRLQRVMSASISYLRQQGVTSQTSLNDIEKKLRIARQSLNRTQSTKSVGYGDEVITIVALRVKQLFQQTTIPIYSHQVKRRFLNEYTQLVANVEVKTIEEIKQLGNSFQELTRNEIIVQNTVGQLYDEWQKIQTKIKSKESFLSSNISLAGSAAYREEQIAHAQLVLQNQLRLDVIESYLNKGARVINTVLLVKKSVEKVFDGQEQAAFLSKLKNFELPTLSAALSVAGQTSDVLNTLFPKSEAAKQVAKFIGYANAAVNIGQGVASLFSGNPLGALSCISGLKSLFGGPPPESAELQMLKRMMGYLQDQFKQVNAKLDQIEYKLDNLITTVQDMYKDMMRSFQYISDQLTEIKQELDGIDTRTKLLLTGRLNFCKLIDAGRLEALKGDSLYLTRYDDYVQLASRNDCKTCLQVLGEFTNPGSAEYVSLSTTEAFELSNPIIKKVYTPTRNLFFSLYKNSIDTALSCLMIPAQKIDNSGKSLSAITRIPDATPFQIADLDKYYNYELITMLTTYLYHYGIIWEIEEKDLQPYPTIEALMDSTNTQLATKKNGLKQRLEAMLNVVNQAILQQSLLAGNLLIDRTYQTLLGYMDDRTEKVHLAIEALKYNKLFAKNFAASIALSAVESRTEIKNDTLLSDSFTDLFIKAKSDDVKLNELRAKFNNQDGFYTFERQNNSEQSVNKANLIIRLKSPHMPEAVDLPLPEPSFILSNEMAQSEGFYALLKAKDQIVSQLIDLDFNNNLKTFNGKNGIFFDDWKYMFSSVRSN